jgi:hypothetical protein
MPNRNASGEETISNFNPLRDALGLPSGGADTCMAGIRRALLAGLYLLAPLGACQPQAFP